MCSMCMTSHRRRLAHGCRQGRAAGNSVGANMGSALACPLYVRGKKDAGGSPSRCPWKRRSSAPSRTSPRSSHEATRRGVGRSAAGG
ncbi:hypothetical protein ACWERW_15345 [Streptomyces sp. NPDC004012]